MLETSRPFRGYSVPKQLREFGQSIKSFERCKRQLPRKGRKTGWKGSIRTFREAWHGTGLPWSLKSHILSDHYEEYFTCFENIADAGAAISSEQSGEMLHSRVQKVWDLRFKTKAENSIFPQRLVDRMVTYNNNLKWDKAIRSEEKLKKIKIQSKNLMMKEIQKSIMKKE